LDNEIKKNEVGGASGIYGGQEKCVQGLVGRADGKRLLGRHGRRWEYNIKANLQEMEWGDMDWIAVAQDRDWWRALVNAVMNLRVP